MDKPKMTIAELLDPEVEITDDNLEDAMDALDQLTGAMVKAYLHDLTERN